MNWIKLSEQQPQEGQAIWWHATNIKTSRPNFHPGYVRNWFPYPEIIIWQPAAVPLPPPNEDEEAFEKWSSNTDTPAYPYFCHGQDTKIPELVRKAMKAAWNAALAWERKK